MLKVAPLIKYLCDNNPQQTPARLTFYNYLSHLIDPEAEINDEIVENFFASCLEYAHWQQNKQQLGREIHALLEQYADINQSMLDLSSIRWPHEIQIIEIEDLKDLTDVIQCYLNSVYKQGQKYRLLFDQDKKLLAVVLNPDHSVYVRHFDKKMILRHGQLEPLRKDLCLYYNSDLELDSERIQKIEMAPFVTAQFQASPEGLRGCLVRGYVCQKFFDLKGDNLASHPKLFYAVKRMEQHFIHRQTDPYYQENVSALERAIEHVRQGDDQAVDESMDVIAKAQNALENVFMGDKLLGLLLRDLQHTLASKHAHTRTVVMTDRKADDSWNSPLQAKTPPPTPSTLRSRIQEKKYDLTN